jgi:radical SAM superfamily enzyme YgiQ (UPF0313 family)
MKVCLIYCGIGVAGFCADRPQGDREGGWIGHGIASIGAITKAAGHDVTLIDLRNLASAGDAIAKIAATKADVFGLSVSPVDGEFAPMIAKAVKHYHPASKVVVGGIHPTIFPERYDFSEIDTVVMGEGEVTFPDLVCQHELGEPLPKMIRGEKPDLDLIPWVDRELFDYQRELDCFFSPGQELPSITMLAGRGCNFLCNYCQPAENAVFGKPHRIRSPHNVVEELKVLKAKYDFKSITFWDDTFTFSKKWVMEFCDLYEREDFGARIAACSRADIICRNEEMVERLASIGCDCFVIGMESGSQRILDFIKKGTTVEQNKQAAIICRKYGVKVFATYMYGLPTETNEEAIATARMIDEIAPDFPSPFYFFPIEGTGIYSYCQDNGLLLESSKNRTIERTGIFVPAIKGVDYGFLNEIMMGRRAC